MPLSKRVISLHAVSLMLAAAVIDHQTELTRVAHLQNDRRIHE
jgi:hypothetical protein